MCYVHVRRYGDCTPRAELRACHRHRLRISGRLPANGARLVPSWLGLEAQPCLGLLSMAQHFSILEREQGASVCQHLRVTCHVYFRFPVGPVPESTSSRHPPLGIRPRTALPPFPPPH